MAKARAKNQAAAEQDTAPAGVTVVQLLNVLSKYPGNTPVEVERLVIDGVPVEL